MSDENEKIASIEEYPESHTIRSKIKIYKDSSMVPEEVELVTRKIVNNPNKTPMPPKGMVVAGTSPDMITNYGTPDEFDNTMDPEDKFVNELLRKDFEENLNVENPLFKLGRVLKNDFAPSSEQPRGHYATSRNKKINAPLIDAEYLKEVAELKCRGDSDDLLASILTACVEQASEGKIAYTFKVLTLQYNVFLRAALTKLNFIVKSQPTEDPNYLSVMVECV